MDRSQRTGSCFISEIELAEEAAPGHVLAESVASSTGPDLRAHAMASSNSAGRRSSDTSMNDPILYKKVIYVPGSAVGFSPFPQHKATDDATSAQCCCLGVGSGRPQLESPGPIGGEEGNTSDRQQQGGCQPFKPQTSVPETDASNLGQHLRRELRHSLIGYAAEWAVGCRTRTLYVAQLMVWACLAPALAFGTWLSRKTAGEIGTAELFMSAFLCGAMFAVFGKQPVLLVGVSAPTVVFVAAVASTADRLSVGFLPWLGWIGIWCSACLMLLAALNASRAASHLSRFSWEVLQVIVAVTLLWDGFQLLVELFTPHAHLDSGLLSLWLATCTLVLALVLSGATAWDYFNRRVLEALQVCAPAIALVLFSVLPLLPLLSRPQLLMVNMPNLPDHTNRTSRFGAIVSLRSLPLWTVFLAFIPGSLLAGLIFFDHICTSLLVQDAIGRKVHNHRARSWDIFVIAASVLLCSFFGLPFSYGLFAQSVTHAQALTTETDNAVDEENQEKPPTAEPHSQRLSALIVALSSAIFLLPAFVYLIRHVPQGVLAGILLQMSVLCLKNLTLIERIKTVCVDSSKDPTRAEGCHLIVRVYSIVQASCVVTVFAVTKTAAALLFPLFLLVTIWLRHDVLHNFFSKREFMLIDHKLFPAGADDSRDRPTVGHLPKFLTQSGPHSLRKLLRDRVGLSGGVSGPVAAGQVGSESARSLESPNVLTMATRRRLKERSKRRYKRKVSTGQSSLETTSSSNINMPLQSRDRLTSASLKKQKSGHYPMLRGSTGSSIHKRQHALYRSRQQQGRGFDRKDSRGVRDSFGEKTVLSASGGNYRLSSQLHASIQGKKSLCPHSSHGNHVVQYKTSPFPPISPQMESPSNTSVLRKSLPSPFRQASPRLESQKLHANSLFDPDWKDSSPTSQSMQVHENLAYLGGEGSSVRGPVSTSSVQHFPRTGNDTSSPSKSSLTLRFSAPVPPNQPLLHDLQRAWEMSSSSWTRGSPANQARVSSFRLCSDAGEDACCYTSCNEVTRQPSGKDVLSNGNSEGSEYNAEPWSTSDYFKQADQVAGTLHETDYLQVAPMSNATTMSSSVWQNGHHNLDLHGTSQEAVIHGWEAVSYPPSAEIRASRFKLASEVLYAEKPRTDRGFDNLEGKSNFEASQVGVEAGKQRLPASSWEDTTSLAAHEDSPEISSFHFSATTDPWMSTNSRTKRKSGSGSELEPGAHSRASEQPVIPGLRPLQRTPERSLRNTRRRSSSSEFTDQVEEYGVAKQPKQPGHSSGTAPVWR